MDYEALRKKMVEEQIVRRGIKEKRILDAFLSVERHALVPSEVREGAYEDSPLPIGEGQTISQPYMVALMTYCLDLKGEEKVLEIGTGSGYQAAILSRLVKEVYSIERVPALAERADDSLSRSGYNNIRIRIADGTMGWKAESPYDGIIVTAAAPKVPEEYIEQLKTGGRLVIPVGTRFSQVLTVIEKRNEGIAHKEVCGCVFVPLVGKDGWQE